MKAKPSTNKKKAGGGAPRKAPAAAKAHAVKLRVTGEQKGEFAAAAAAAGLSLSSWMVTTCLKSLVS